VATYPIRSDESKGEGGQFGSKKIEYDIIHVCRKRLEAPQAVSYARMRRWVKQESAQLKLMLEHTHGADLPESDLRVILCGKALEFYSRHYGEVRTGEGEILTVRDALIGINQLLDDLISEGGGGIRAPEEAEPTSRLFLSIFAGRDTIPRDELHKILRGTGIAQGDLESRGWVKAAGTTIHVLPVAERFDYFTARGRTRKVLKTDLDQAHFLIGAALPGSNLNIERELDKGSFRVKASVGPIASWLAETAADTTTRDAARLAAQLLDHWRTKISKLPEDKQMTFLDQLGMRDAE